jgi:hypothetical protein
VQSWAAIRPPRSSSASGPASVRSPSTGTRLLAPADGARRRRPADYDLTDPSDERGVFRYEMHTLPSEIGDRIGTSTLFAAWNAVIYVNQIEDERLQERCSESTTSRSTQDVLQEHGALWFNDEASSSNAAP